MVFIWRVRRQKLEMARRFCDFFFFLSFLSHLASLKRDEASLVGAARTRAKAAEEEREAVGSVTFVDGRTI